jgi:hypothetical protein
MTAKTKAKLMLGVSAIALMAQTAEFKAEFVWTNLGAACRTVLVVGPWAPHGTEREYPSAPVRASYVAAVSGVGSTSGALSGAVYETAGSTLKAPSI